MTVLIGRDDDQGSKDPQGSVKSVTELPQEENPSIQQSLPIRTVTSVKRENRGDGDSDVHPGKCHIHFNGVNKTLGKQ